MSPQPCTKDRAAKKVVQQLIGLGAVAWQEHVEEGEAEDEGKDDSKEEGDKGEKTKTGEYEFSAWEERVLQVVMDSLRMAGLATALHALASILLGEWPICS